MLLFWHQSKRKQYRREKGSEITNPLQTLKNQIIQQYPRLQPNQIQ